MRVIAGALRGRRLVSPKGRDTRPTSDRVREAIFSALGSIEGARVLDLYAGSGALAIEALSRGAREAIAVERAAPALLALRKNLTALGLEDRCQVFGTTVERALSALAREPFDLVLADPPYADTDAAIVAIDALVEKGACAPDARIVVEHSSRVVAPCLAGVELLRTRRYGDTAVSFYNRAFDDPFDDRGGSTLAAD